MVEMSWNVGLSADGLYLSTCILILFHGLQAEYLKDPEPEIQDTLPDWLADLDEPSEMGAGDSGQ